MSMTRRGTNKDLGFIIGTMEEFVPEDHLVRKMEEALKWDFIYPLVEPLYSLWGKTFDRSGDLIQDDLHQLHVQHQFDAQDL